MKFLNPQLTRECLKLALPVMLTQAGQISVNLFDNIIVGRLLGADALAAVSLGNAVFFSVFVFALGFSFAIPPLVSEAHTQEDHGRINSVFRHGLVINITIGLLLTIILILALPLLYHLGQPAQIIPQTTQFLSIMIISILPFMVFQTLREVSEGLSYTIGVTKATIIANIINIILNFVFIKGLFGVSPMGVRGSAYASLIARIIMAIFLGIVLLRTEKTRRYMQDFSLRIRYFSKEVLLKMLSLGFPTALQMFFEVAAFAAAAFICGLASSHDIAAHQIALSMASFTFNLCIGFSVASTVMVGRKVGERDYINLREIGKNNLKIVFLFMLCCGLVFIAARHVIPGFFTKPGETEVDLLAAKLLMIAALFQLSDGIQVVSLGMLRGMQDVKIPSLLTFVAYWVLTIPLAYYLCVYQKMGAFGVWIALGFGLMVAATLLILRFLKLSKSMITKHH